MRRNEMMPTRSCGTTRDGGVPFKILASFSILVVLATLSARPANGALTAFAVPAGTSNSAWVGADAGWTGPLNVSPNPFATFQTVQNPNGLWRAWAGPDNKNLPTFDIATRVLSSPLAAGQTFRAGYESPAGTFAIGQIGSGNSVTIAWRIDSFANYAYSDGGAQQADTGIPSGTPVDIQLTYGNSTTHAYTGTMSAIGNPSQSFSWSGTLADDVNGFYLQNSGSSISQSIGIRYIEVGSGVLPDPATLVPEPELVAFSPVVVVGLLARKRR